MSAVCWHVIVNTKLHDVIKPQKPWYLSDITSYNVVACMRTANINFQGVFA